MLTEKTIFGEKLTFFMQNCNHLQNFLTFIKFSDFSKQKFEIPSLFYTLKKNKLTLKVLVATTDAQWEGMGDVHVGLTVGSERYEPALLPPCPTIRVLSYSN